MTDDVVDDDLIEGDGLLSDQLLDGQYPLRWSEYVGQEKAKRHLKRMAKAAAIRGDQMRHVLICSPEPGVGKTALGILVARTLKRPVYMASGRIKLPEARMMFSQLSDAGETILMDEAHESGKEAWLHNWMESGTMLTPFGEEETPPATLVAMTTDKGKILPAIQTRFTIVELEPYTDQEAAQIAVQLASKVMPTLPVPDPEVAARIAQAGSNQPRLMRNLLFTLLDMVTIGEVEAPEDGSYELTEALEAAGLTEDGLNDEAQKYLNLMYRDMRGQPTGAGIINARLGLAGAGLELVEKLLAKKGYLMTTKQGRMLSAAGMKRAKTLAEMA